MLAHKIRGQLSKFGVGVQKQVCPVTTEKLLFSLTHRLKLVRVSLAELHPYNGLDCCSHLARCTRYASRLATCAAASYASPWLMVDTFLRV